jgi:hypothetical protein
MNISNVMAITESEYYTDQYMKYADNMINELEDDSLYIQDGYNSDKKRYDNYDHKQKDSKSVSISNINCKSININNNGEINISGATSGIAEAGEGSEVGQTASISGNGERYLDSFKDKNPLCITINNNTIVNNNATADDNGVVTCPNCTCEECFTKLLTPQQVANMEIIFEVGVRIVIDGEPLIINSFSEFCDVLAQREVTLEGTTNSLEDLLGLQVNPQQIPVIAACIANALGLELEGN